MSAASRLGAPHRAPARRSRFDAVLVLGATATLVAGGVGIATSAADDAPPSPQVAAVVATRTAADTRSTVAALVARQEALAARDAQRQDAHERAAAVARKKAAVKRAKARAAAAAKALAAAQANPKKVARNLLADYGFGADQWSCLSTLWTGESNWDYRAANAASGAYGLPQALPGAKMASVAADWATNPATQIRWGLHYIKATYGSPCAALGAWNSRYPHWY